MSTSLLVEAAVENSSFFTHENLMDLLLITLPTVLLAIATLWDNDRMYKITMQALSRLYPKKVRERKGFHGKHEAIEDAPKSKVPPQHNNPKLDADSNMLAKLESEK